MVTIPVILAGGFGTRLWPISTAELPKQFANLLGDKTLFQNTVERICKFPGVNEIKVICNQKHAGLVSQQLQDFGISNFNAFLEPMGKNTAPAITIAALSVPEDAILIVLPSDHMIADVEKFHRALEIGMQCAEQNYLVCFGVIPNRPETGYGYIKIGEHQGEAYKIEKFVEKPNMELALQYIATQDYYWNSGIFMFRAGVFLKEMAQFAPDILDCCKKVLKNSVPEGNFLNLSAEYFSQCRSDSIDYAVMEKTSRAIMVPLDARWSDVGSWFLLWEQQNKDENNNVIMGDVVVHEVEGSYIHSTSRKVVAVGIKGHIIIETSDAVLIVPKEKHQEVKKIFHDF